MTKKQANVSISRVSSHRNDGRIRITIEDAMSSIDIVEVEMDFADFAQCLTGMSMSPATINRMVAPDVIENVGKRLETKSVACDKVWSDKNVQRETVRQHLIDSGLAADGWCIMRDGTSSRQDGKDHIYIAYRYIDVEEGE